MLAASLIWMQVRERANGLGLNRLWAVPRASVDSYYADAPADAATPATLHPGYRTALVLASQGNDLWRGFRAAHSPDEGAPLDPAQDLFDRYTELAVETLKASILPADETLVSAYPFRHERQLMGFSRLLHGLGDWSGAGPFGIAVHPQAGPWWALRGVLLTELEFPSRMRSEASPCAECPAPCVAACPAGAVHKDAFAGAVCAEFRLSASTCHETCLSRVACPVGSEYRYEQEAERYHARASLVQIQEMAAAGQS